MTDEEAKANRAAAVERVKAMKAKRLDNPPPPRVRKPMSDEVKAMLKERRDAKKAVTRPSSPTTTPKERRAAAAKRAIGLTQNKPMDYVPKARKPMSDETKAMLKERRAAKKAATTPSERTTTHKERRQAASKRAIGLTQNKPVDYVPKARKPMSDETKAMLKERRAMKKAIVSEKFEAFWNRHEGTPAGGPLVGTGVRTLTLAQIANDAAQSALNRVLTNVVHLAPKVRTKKNGEPYKKRESADNKDLRLRRERSALDPASIKPVGVASKMRKPRKPTTRKTKLTPLSADEMAFHSNLLG